MTTSYRISGFVVSVMLWAMCACGSGGSSHHYRIKYLTDANFMERGSGIQGVKVLALDTRDGTEHRVDETFKDKIAQEWCYKWDTITPGAPPQPYNRVAIDLLMSPQVRHLIASSGGTNETLAIANSVCCSPQTGLKGLECHAELPAPNGSLADRLRAIAHFYCICDADDGGLIYVDGEPIEEYVTQNVRCYRTQDGDWPPDYKPVFDRDGTRFYYIMHRLAMRFNVATHMIDTIPGADVSLIPWNRDAVIVYSREDEEVSLLGEADEVKAQVDWELDGTVTIVYAVDSTTYLVGVRRVYEAPGSFGVDVSTLTYFYELDFYSKSTRLLTDGVVNPGQILSAERVE